MLRKISIKITMIVVLLVTLSMVGASVSSFSQDSDQINLRFSVWGNPQELETWKTVVELFESRNPNINIELIHQPVDQYESKLRTMIAGGNAPDIMWLFEVTTPIFARKGLLLNLAPYIERDEEFSLDSFFPNTLSLAKYKDGIYGLPFSVSPQVLYYNKEAFDKAGISYPDESWHWEDLIKAAKQLTIKENGKVEQWGMWSTTWDVPNQVYMWQNGGSLFNHDNLYNYPPDERESLLDQPATYEAIQFFADNGLVRGITPKPTQAKLGLTSGMFETGKVAMNMQGIWMIPSYREACDFEWDIAPLPYPEGGKRATVLHASYVTISKQTEYPEAAWKFVKFYTGPVGQRIITESLNQVPTRKAVAATEPWLSVGKPPANSDIIGEALEYGKLLQVAPNYTEISRRLSSAIEEIYLGEASAEEAFKKLDKTVEELIAE